MLFVIEKQLAVYRQRIEELFARHPDHDLFRSLPGAGPKIAPRLLAEIGDDRERFDGDAQNLQCLGGTAPVTKRSGKYRHCHQRWACDKHLRHAIHLFAEQSLSRCAWAQIYYQHHRQKERRSAQDGSATSGSGFGTEKSARRAPERGSAVGIGACRSASDTVPAAPPIHRVAAASLSRKRLLGVNCGR